MFTWYRNADKYYAYLTDVPSHTNNQNSSETLEAAFLESRMVYPRLDTSRAYYAAIG